MLCNLKQQNISSDSGWESRASVRKNAAFSATSEIKEIISVVRNFSLVLNAFCANI